MNPLRDWLAYHLVMHVLPGPHSFPDWRQRLIDRVTLWLLPYAGLWAYRGDRES